MHTGRSRKLFLRTEPVGRKRRRSRWRPRFIVARKGANDLAATVLNFKLNFTLSGGLQVIVEDSSRRWIFAGRDLRSQWGVVVGAGSDTDRRPRIEKIKRRDFPLPGLAQGRNIIGGPEEPTGCGHNQIIVFSHRTRPQSR